MTPPRELIQKIEGEYHVFLASPGPDPLNLKQIARELGVVPVVRGWDRLGALRLDGTLVDIDYEPPYTAVEVEHRADRLTLLGFCAAKLPSLAELRPVRPADAFDCALCKGTGREATASDGICICGGLGWMVPTPGAV
jgi:hypothetical protein